MQSPHVGNILFSVGGKRIASPPWSQAVMMPLWTISGPYKDPLNFLPFNRTSSTPLPTGVLFILQNLEQRTSLVAQWLRICLARTLYDINHSKILFDPAPREMEIKTKINKWDLMKLKSFYTAKETINKTKRQPQNGRKYLQMKQLTKD